MKTGRILLSVLAVCSVMPVQARVKFEVGMSYSDSTILKKIGKVGIGLSAACLTGYGAWKLFNHFTYKHATSHSGVTSWNDRLCVLTDMAKRRYKVMTDVIVNDHIDSGIVTEEALYQLALEKRNDVPIDRYIETLRMTIEEIKTCIDALLKNAPSEDTQFNGPEEGEFNAILYLLAMLLEILEHHKNYFVLFELEATLMRTYERDLYAVEIYQNNEACLREMLQQSAHLRSSRNSSAHQRYLNDIKADRDALQKCMQSLAYNYENRLQVSGELLAKLDRIYTTLEAIL